jgi:hypothetical protein
VAHGGSHLWNEWLTFERFEEVSSSLEAVDLERFRLAGWDGTFRGWAGTKAGRVSDASFSSSDTVEDAEVEVVAGLAAACLFFFSSRAMEAFRRA